MFANDRHHPCCPFAEGGSLQTITLAMTLKNSINTLPQALSGIGNLDYDKKQIKLVFVDGGSTDGSFEVLKDFYRVNKQNYQDVLVMTGDYNVIEGRNLAIRNAEGELILFIDSDVVVPSNLLLEVHKIFSSDPRIAFINIPCVVEEERAGWARKKTSLSPESF